MLERLGKVVVAAGLQSAHYILGFGFRGNEDHRNEAVHGVLLEALHHLDAVHLWHHDIEQDQVWLKLSGARERILAVNGRHDLVTLGFETDAQNIEVGRNVVDGKNAWRMSQPPALVALSGGSPAPSPGSGAGCMAWQCSRRTLRGVFSPRRRIEHRTSLR